MARAPDICLVVCFEDDRRARFVMVRHQRRGWELPGGRIETGESPEAAARREFEEETGHQVLALRPVLRQNRGARDAWVYSGTWGPPIGALAREAEPTVEFRFVGRLGDVSPLAFPDDPYGPIEAALGRPIR